MRISDWSSDVCSSDLLSTRQAWERAAVAAEAKPRRWERSGEMSKKILIELGDGGCNGRMIGRMATGAAGGSERQPMIVAIHGGGFTSRSEEHTSELQSLMRISYAVFCLKKKIQQTNIHNENQSTS